MKKFLKFSITLLAGCIGLGVIVSRLEKKKGWFNGHKPYGFYEKHMKRPLDFGLSLFAVLFLNSGRAVFAGGVPQRRFIE